MAYTYAILRFALSGFFMALLASCGQGESATKADPNNIYTDENWTGVTFPDYRDLTKFARVGPFDDADQCLAAIDASGVLSSHRGAFECCIIDDQYENSPGLQERFKICEHNFGLFALSVEDYHDANTPCETAEALCNERGQLVRELVQNSQRNGEIYASQIESALQELLSPDADLKTKEDARTRLLRAYNGAARNVSLIKRQIHLDGPMKSHADIERQLVSGRDSATSPDDEQLFKEALTGLNRALIVDTLADIVERATSLIKGENSPIAALAMQTSVGVVIKFDGDTQLSRLNAIFDGMSAAEIADKKQLLSSIGLIRIDKTSEPDTHYFCTKGIGNAYRLKYLMHAIDFAGNRVTGAVELVGGAPPEKIESYKCEGVGPPPDWSGYFEVADIN